MAKGGGAWKVAYADFVTAMMAFFLVMWICAQDQKIKQAVARYFVTPMGVVETGASKTPNETGALFPRPTAGEMPVSDAIALGRGRKSFTPPSDTPSKATNAICNWVRTDDQADAYWRDQVRLTREWASMSKDLLNKDGSIDAAITKQLSKQLRSEITHRVSSELNDLSRDLLSQILSEVNWTELAEDMLAHYDEEEPRQ
jgi:flagellar motor protein MotB